MIALVLAAAAATAADPPDDQAAALAQLRQVYEQSCSARAYAAYDDVCDQLDQQVRRAEAEARRHPRRAEPAPPPVKVAAPATPPPHADLPVTTPPSAPDLTGKPPP
jgi:hypothetical protein